MLHVVDNLLPSEEIPALRQLCGLHGHLKQASEGRDLFSWIPADPSDRSGRSLHAADQQSLMDRYIRQRLGPLLDRFAPPSRWLRMVVQHQQRPRLAHRQARSDCRKRRSLCPAAAVHGLLPPRQLCRRRTADRRQRACAAEQPHRLPQFPFGDLCATCCESRGAVLSRDAASDQPIRRGAVLRCRECLGSPADGVRPNH